MYKIFFLPMLMQRGIANPDDLIQENIQRQRIIERRKIENLSSPHDDLCISNAREESFVLNKQEQNQFSTYRNSIHPFNESFGNFLNIFSTFF